MPDIPWAIGMLIGGGLTSLLHLNPLDWLYGLEKNLILNDIPISLIVIAVVAAMVFLTEINSNIPQLYFCLY